MRFSAVFDAVISPRASAPEEDIRPDPAGAAPRYQADTALPPEDLDDRVRRVGEWQLEDW